MKLVKKEMIHWMDQKASSDYAILSILLMEHAAQALCQAFCQLYDQSNRVCIVCGPGNNGGDGFALARLLYQKQYSVSVYCPVSFDKMSHDECINAKMVEALEIPYNQTFDAFLVELNQCDVCVDALFGVGLARDIQGDYANLIMAINQSDKEIVSIDIPSGIDGNTGMKKGHAIIAHHTLTLAAYKEGLFINDARKHCGKITLLDIQIPPKLMNECEGATVIDEALVLSHLPKRSLYSHKGSYGKTLMIGGSMSMHGALTLAAKACLQSGIGTLTLFVPDCILPILAMKLEECMLLSAPSKEGFFDEQAIPLLKAVIQQYDFIVIGNGMGRSEICRKMIEVVLQSEKPCIMDGDGIYLAAQCEIPKHKDILMTPHVKEMSYLCHLEMKEIITQPFKMATTYVRQYPNVTIVYKDAFTLITNMNESYFYYLPNTALAKGGSGDVLCGIIAGMYGQNKDMIKAACCGVYLHSQCAIETCEQYGVDSSQASNLIDEIEKILKKLRKSKKNTCKL